MSAACGISFNVKLVCRDDVLLVCLTPADADKCNEGEFCGGAVVNSDSPVDIEADVVIDCDECKEETTVHVHIFECPPEEEDE